MNGRNRQSAFFIKSDFVAKTGFQYYSVETDRYQDKRIRRLKKECGCNGIAVYDFILCEIYRVKGCFLEWDESTAFDVADYFGLKESQVKEIVNYCCAVGLFDRGLFTSESILTSHSIQSRFMDWSIKAKRSKATIPEKIILLPEEHGNIEEETGRTSGSFSQSKVKESKETESSDVKEKPPPSFGNSVLKNIEDLKRECLNDRVNFVEHICRQTKISPEEVPKLLEDFNSHLRSIGETVKGVKDYRNHAQNWIKKQPEAQHTVEQQKVKIRVK